ncbi:MAG: hypothetical protein OHK0023_28900 [Anaerolineae bacterium]
MRFFISYSKTRDAVSNLRDDLELLFPDCEVWFDQQMKGSGGQEWWDMICEAIRACDVFIYALSPYTLDSEACHREYQYARSLNRPLVPPFLEQIDIARLPLDLQVAQLVDYIAPDNSKKRNLRDSIRALPRRGLPDPLPPQPPVPIDPVGVLFERIRNLSADPNEQAVLIVDIDDLRFDVRYAARRKDLLEALIRREDVLTMRSHRRLTELLATVPTPAAQKPTAPAKQPQSESAAQSFSPFAPGSAEIIQEASKLAEKAVTTHKHRYGLRLQSAGPNKADVVSTLTRLGNFERARANYLVETLPMLVLESASEAEITQAKEALERVGAVVEFGPLVSIYLAEIGPQKINVIKVIRRYTELGLKEAKDIVEAAPTTVIASLLKEYGPQVLADFAEIGARAEIREG